MIVPRKYNEQIKIEKYSILFTGKYTMSDKMIDKMIEN